MDAFSQPLAGGEVELDIARDLARRSAMVAPLVVLVGFLVAGGPGSAGAALGLAMVAANFLLAAALLSWSARISPAALAGAALGGYVVRLALVAAVGIGVRGLDWVHFPTFCIVLVVAHLGLLVWELRAVSLSLAAPGLRPAKQ